MITKSQQMMVDDGLPAALIMTPEERRLAWRNVRAKNPKFTDHVMERQSKLKEEARKLQAAEAKRREEEAKSKKRGSASSPSHEGETWDTRHCRWVKIPGWKKPRAKKPEKVSSLDASKISEQFKVKAGTHKAALLEILAASMAKPRTAESLALEVYGEKGKEGALAGVIKGLQVAIEKGKLPWLLEKTEGGWSLSEG